MNRPTAWNSTLRPGKPPKRKKPISRGVARLRAIGKKARRKKAGQFGEQASMCRKSPCCACQAPPPSDPHHYPSRAAGGKDADTVPLCRYCHRCLHNVGVETFQRNMSVDFEDVKRTMRRRVG